MLESANMILYWDRSIIPDKTASINRPDTVFIYREIGTAFVVDTAVPYTHDLPKTKAEKITKCDNFALEIKKYQEV